MNQILLMRCLALVAFTLSIPMSYANIVNGDFSNGLNGWNYQGSVSTSSGTGILDDSQAYHSQLYQSAALGSGHFSFSFDFYNGLSGARDQSNPFTFPDSFFASLYFSNNNAFDPNAPGSLDTYIGLFDLSAGNVSNLTGHLQMLPMTDGWMHYTLSFDSAFAYVIPVFDLYADGGIPGDSQVMLDNIKITAPVIPEPATFMLIGSGLLMSLAGRRRRT